MLIYVMCILLTALATEATIKVLLSGKVFETPRTYIFSKVKEEAFFGKLIRCPYCLSFWVSLCLLSVLCLFPKVWLVYCSWLAVQRIANVMDDVIDRIYYGQYGPSGLEFKDKE